MKKIGTVLTAAFLRIACVVLLHGCQSSGQKEEAKVKTDPPGYDLLAVQEEADELAALLPNPEDWIILIEECESKIKANDTEIEALKRYAEITETTRENTFVTKIDSLQQRNIYLRFRIKRLEKRRAEWELLHIDVRNVKKDSDQIM